MTVYGTSGPWNSDHCVKGQCKWCYLSMEPNQIVRGIHIEQCTVLVDHVNQAIGGIDNAGGVNRPCIWEDCEWEP
jgi:hypothetical protein